MTILEIIISILTGIATCIPLVIKLVQYVQVATKEKNWINLLKLLNDLMAEAETLYETGAERKVWVLSMIKASAKSINYDIDIDVISKLIDDIIALTKVVNVPESK
jgi:signal transduction histidine kinase